MYSPEGLENTPLLTFSIFILVWFSQFVILEMFGFQVLYQVISAPIFSYYYYKRARDTFCFSFFFV